MRSSEALNLVSFIIPPYKKCVVQPGYFPIIGYFILFVLVGGSESYRSYWRNFCATTDLVLFVVDANQSGKFHQAKEFIFEVVTELEVRGNFNVISFLFHTNLNI